MDTRPCAPPSSPKVRILSDSTAIAITGTAFYYPKPPGGLTREGVLQLWEEVEPEFCCTNVVQECFNPKERISADVVDRVGNQLASRIHTFVRQRIGMPAKNAAVCNVVIVQHDAASGVTRVALSSLHTDHRGATRARPPHYNEISHTGPKDFSFFGETTFVEDNVLAPGSVGHPHLGANYAHWRDATNADDLSAEQAIGMAREILMGAEKAAELIPSASAIGGTPLIYHITGTAPPLQI